MTTKIRIVIRSFENNFCGLPPYTRKIGLPESQVLYTVLRSPHIDKKSREQFKRRATSIFILISGFIFNTLIWKIFLMQNLPMDELSQALAQFYTPGWSAGGMDCGFNQPPAPENATFIVAPPSDEAGPSDPNSHLDRKRLEKMQEENNLLKERFEKMQEENQRRLLDNDDLFNRAEAGHRRLDESLENQRLQDARRDEAARQTEEMVLEAEIEFIQTELPKLLREQSR